MSRLNSYMNSNHFKAAEAKEESRRRHYEESLYEQRMGHACEPDDEPKQEKEEEKNNESR